jgi:hypothetical protein
LSKYRPADFFDAATPAANNPGRVTVLVHDLFDLFGVYAMPSDMLNIILVPLRL